MSKGDEKLVRLDAALALRDRFLGWQCRIRKHAVRQAGGRPSQGMRPRAAARDGRVIAEAITLLIVPRDPTPVIYRWRHLVRSSHDPAERLAKAIAILAADYFQRSGRFSDVMTASFGEGSSLAALLVQEAYCVLQFSERTQRYDLPCAVTPLTAADPAWQHTYWHNLLFNPALSPATEILAFAPRWSEAAMRPGNGSRADFPLTLPRS